MGERLGVTVGPVGRCRHMVGVKVCVAVRVGVGDGVAVRVQVGVLGFG